MKYTKINQENDILFTLIKSLTKSEKRQFSLFVGRLAGNKGAKFVTLFKFLDKQKDYDEKAIIKSGIVSKQQLPNLKAHLYKQILISLRMNPSLKNVRIQTREQLNFATVLYQKGLYKQSLKILAKAKEVALDNEEKDIAYEIVEFEKVIESQYITRSIRNRADELTEQAKELSRQNIIASKLSNLSLNLYSILLKIGYARNEKEQERVNNYFKARLPKYDYAKSGFRERLWFYKAHLWRCFLTQDFVHGYKYSSQLVSLFREYPRMIEENPVFYLKGINYFLESLYFVKKTDEFLSELSIFEKEIKEGTVIKNNNTEILVFQYHYSNQLHKHFLLGTFRQGEYLVDEIVNKIKIYEGLLDNHHIVILYYKIACLYFGMSDYKNCIKFLKKIINAKKLYVGEDLQCFARILNLIAHYESGLDYNLERQFKETYRFLLKMENLQGVQKVLLESISSLSEMYPHEFKKEFKRLYHELKTYENHPFEKRTFLYLDIISWLESKIYNLTVEEIVQQKANGTFIINN